MLPMNLSSKRLPNGFAKEYRLHEQLKQYYGLGADGIEVEVDGCIVDVVKGGRIIEVQTANLSALRRKLARLLPQHWVTVVFPVPKERYIVWLSPSDRHELHRRRSPKRGQWFEVFKELPHLAPYLKHRHFSLEVVLTKENDFRVNDGRGSWRRGGARTVDRELVDVLGTEYFATPRSYRRVLPDGLPEPFTSRDLAHARDMPLRLAQKAMYSLRSAGTVCIAGKRRNAILYTTKTCSGGRRTKWRADAFHLNH